VCFGTVVKCCGVAKVWISSLKHAGEDYLVLSYAFRRPRTFAELTNTELLVIEGALAGDSAAAMARRRRVSKRTIENQLVRAYRKLGVTSRAELTAVVSSPRRAERG
jgi:DNA-binding NarL/FixJ family response regulator